MRRLLLFVVVVAVAAGALGYWRGWFSLTSESTVDVQVDADKFKQEKDAFSKSFGQKVQATKDKIASLMKKSEWLTSNEKSLTQQQLDELKTKHRPRKEQIKELDDAGHDRVERVQQNLSKTTQEVEKKVEELTTRLEREKEEKNIGRTPGQETVPRMDLRMQSVVCRGVHGGIL